MESSLSQLQRQQITLVSLKIDRGRISQTIVAKLTPLKLKPNPLNEFCIIPQTAIDRPVPDGRRHDLRQSLRYKGSESIQNL